MGGGPRCSHGHLSRTVGGVALLPCVGVVGGLRRVMHFYMLHLARAPSHASVQRPVWLAEDVRRVFRALLPLARVAVSPGGAVHGGDGGGGGVPRGGGLPVDMAGTRLPGFESRAREQRVRGGLGEVQVFQVAGGDGNGERGVEVVVRRNRLVDVGLLFGLHGHWLEGWSRHVLVLREVHEWEALVVASRRAVCWKREKGGKFSTRFVHINLCCWVFMCILLY